MLVSEISPTELEQYAQVPIAFEVKSIFRVETLERGLGGIRLVEESVEPYAKNYDAYDTPTRWREMFDVSNWGFFLAREENEPIGGATVAWNTNQVNLLESRVDLSVLWDLRVHPKWRGRGVGAELLRRAAEWSAQRYCSQMKIETQNINVPACRFYARMGCELGDIRRFGYADNPTVSHEVQLNWYLEL